MSKSRKIVTQPRSCWYTSSNAFQFRFRIACSCGFLLVLWLVVSNVALRTCTWTHHEVSPKRSFVYARSRDERRREGHRCGKWWGKLVNPFYTFVNFILLSAETVSFLGYRRRATNDWISIPGITWRSGFVVISLCTWECRLCHVSEISTDRCQFRNEVVLRNRQRGNSNFRLFVRVCDPEMNACWNSHR